MKKLISTLLMILLALPLAACGGKADTTDIPTDTERVVELALDTGNAASAEKPAPTAPAVAYAQEQYHFSTTAAEGLLTVNADAQVTYPASLQMPVARVSAEGFTQEQASAYFDYFFAGKQPTVVVNNGAAKETKQSLRDLIALYETQIADGTILQQQQLTEDEAREEIKRLEERIPDAPDTLPPDVVSDGTMLPGVWMDNDDPEPLMELNVETENEWMDIYTPVNADEHAEGHFFFHFREGRDYSEASSTPLAPDASIQGMNMSWDEAMTLCKEFLAIGGENDMTVGESFQLDANGKHAYRFTFVRTVFGVSLAVNHEITTYKGSDTPWSYEELTITIDDEGICDVGWAAPVKTTALVNGFANAIPFTQAKEIFETMVVESYTPDTTRYNGEKRNISITVDEIILSILRIRDVSTDERVGLYVPAWVFYGKTLSDGYPDKKWEPRIVFAINALDGSVIDMEQGY